MRTNYVSLPERLAAITIPQDFERPNLPGFLFERFAGAYEEAVRYHLLYDIKTPLSHSHVSPKTAYVIESYPSGWQRCQKLVYIESKFYPNKKGGGLKGQRSVYQTTNVKSAGSTDYPPDHALNQAGFGTLYVSPGLEEVEPGMEITHDLGLVGWRRHDMLCNPHKGTYSEIVFMYIEGEKGHVKYCHISLHDNLFKLALTRQAFKDTMSEVQREAMSIQFLFCGLHMLLHDKIKDAEFEEIKKLSILWQAHGTSDSEGAELLDL